MTRGADTPKKLAFAAVLLVIGVFLFVHTFFTGPSQPAAATAADSRAGEPASRPANRTGRRAPARRRAITDTPSSRKGPVSLDPRLRLDLLKSSEQMEYKGSGRNIFRAQAEPVEIPKPIVSPVNPTSAAAPAPPGPPPINLKFFGFASRPGEPKRVFLSQGEDVFIAGEGDIVARRYKVLKIAPTTVEIEDVLSNHRQTLLLTQS